MWGGRTALLSNFGSEFHVLPASAICASLASKAPWLSFNGRAPTALETSYVFWACKQDLNLPTTQEFHDRSIQATNVKDKFKLMKDLKPDTFCDLLGEVSKVFDSRYDIVTVYLSDYTPHKDFYNHVWGGSSEGGRDGDDYGYIKSRPKTTDWPGPFGKMSIQLTLFDGHAAFARENVKANQWILLRNVQIKFGRTGGCLEGFQRGEQQGYDGRHRIQIMKPAAEGDDNNARWKEGVRRKLEWQKKFAKQKEAFENANSGAGEKRKRKWNGEDGLGKNGRQRRKMKRAAGHARGDAERLGLNPNGTYNSTNFSQQKKKFVFAKKFEDPLTLQTVQCSYRNKPIIRLSEFVKPRPISNSPEHADIYAPFTVSNCRANVRVVDYFPEKIEDFAVGRRVTEYDILSDYSGGEDFDSEEDMKSFRSGKGFVERKWEWRFALIVEDSSFPQERIILLVDNQSAQMLLGLDEDACKYVIQYPLASKLLT